MALVITIILVILPLHHSQKLISPQDHPTLRCILEYTCIIEAYTSENRKSLRSFSLESILF